MWILPTLSVDSPAAAAAGVCTGYRIKYVRLLPPPYSIYRIKYLRQAGTATAIVYITS